MSAAQRAANGLPTTALIVVGAIIVAAAILIRVLIWAAERRTERSVYAISAQGRRDRGPARHRRATRRRGRLLPARPGRVNHD